MEKYRYICKGVRTRKDKYNRTESYAGKVKGEGKVNKEGLK